MKRWNTTLIVVAVFVALLAYVLLVEVKRASVPEDDSTPTPTPLPLLSLDAGDVQVVQISDGERLLRLEQVVDGWQIVAAGSGLVEPEPGSTDLYSVFISVNDLAQLKASRVLRETVQDGAQYGLEPARLTLIVVQRSGMEHRVLVGKQTTDEMSYYVQMEGDGRLYLVNQYTLQPFFNWLDQPPYQAPASE